MAAIGACAPTAMPPTQPLPSQLPDAAPASPPPGLEHLPDPAVTDEPTLPSKSRPYEVFGERYEVLPTAHGYAAEGLASWYGTRFHGLATATGEQYSMYSLTAAHKSLPLPSWVRVTNLENGRSSIVRVNDRGPFHPGRIIDLSYAAAVKLGFADAGTARVRVETVTPEPVAPKPPPRYFVHAGPFADFGSAATKVDELGRVLDIEAFVARIRDAFVVRIGPFGDRDMAERLQMLVAFGEQWSPVIIEE